MMVDIENAVDIREEYNKVRCASVCMFIGL